MRLMIAWGLVSAGISAVVYGVFLVAGMGPAFIAAGVMTAGCGLFLVDVDPLRKAADVGELGELGDLLPEGIPALPSRRAG